MSELSGASDTKNLPTNSLGESQRLFKQWQLDEGKLSLSNPPRKISKFPDSQRLSKQWEHTGDGQRQLLVSDTIESKKILGNECSKEIHRLTQLVKSLQREQQAIRKAYELKYPSCYPSRPPTSRHTLTSNEESKKSKVPRKITARGIRKVQRSKQLDEQSIGDLLGDIDIQDRIKSQISAAMALEEKGLQEIEEYELEIEISDKRLNKEEIEYQVQKRISFCSWQSIENLTMANMYDFVKIFDRKQQETLSEELANERRRDIGSSPWDNPVNVFPSPDDHGKNDLLKNNPPAVFISPEDREPFMSVNNFGDEAIQDTLMNSSLRSRNASPSQLKDSGDEIEHIVVQELNIDLDYQTEESEPDKDDWFYLQSDGNYVFSQTPSSENLTTEVHNTTESDTLSNTNYSQ